ncbi:MAG: biosynthetic-type acetolactate synthase large subunit, partial [Oscillospiraceae bacterium]
MINGAEIMVNALKKEGTRVVFGYPGAAICPFFDAVYRDGGIETILVRQEQNAGHAASGYARAGNTVGVCAVTSGPGATNLITAIASAYIDSIPMVAITGQVHSWLIGRDAFQEADITGACEPFTKNSYLVKNVADLPQIIKEAFYLAKTGRPGPVLIDVPIDIQLMQIEPPAYPDSVHITGYQPSINGNDLQIKRACELIEKSKKPLILSGGGLFLSDNAIEQLRILIEKTEIPQICTMMALGALPSEHKLNLGMLGMHGSAAANAAVSNADLILICGARLGDRSLPSADRIHKSTNVIHIDVDPAEIGKNADYTVPIVGDLAHVIKKINERINYTCPDKWTELCLSRRLPMGFESNSSQINPKNFISRLTDKLDENCIYCADVGQNQIWSANYHKIKGGRFLTSGGMGTMGYSLSAAMGAKLAKNDVQCIAVCGDGSFQMQFMELATM